MRQPESRWSGLYMGHPVQSGIYWQRAVIPASLQPYAPGLAVDLAGVYQGGCGLRGGTKSRRAPPTLPSILLGRQYRKPSMQCEEGVKQVTYMH